MSEQFGASETTAWSVYSPKTDSNSGLGSKCRLASGILSMDTVSDSHSTNCQTRIPVTNAVKVVVASSTSIRTFGVGRLKITKVSFKNWGLEERLNSFLTSCFYVTRGLSRVERRTLVNLTLQNSFIFGVYTMPLNQTNLTSHHIAPIANWSLVIYVCLGK